MPITSTTPNSTGPYLAVLPHPPSCSTNPHGGGLHRPLNPRHLVFHFPTTSSGTPTSTNPPCGTAAMFFCYLSSRRQPTPSPTSAPSCFSLSNHLLRHSHFYQSSWRHRRHLLLLPILTAAAYIRAILFFTLQPRPVFLSHSHLCITATVYTATNVPYLRAILLFTFQPRQALPHLEVKEGVVPP